MAAEVCVNSLTICVMGRSALDRWAYRLLLRDELGRDVTVESDFVPVSVWAALRSRPDLVLVDADAPTTEVIEAVQMLRRLRPEVRIVVIGAAVEPTVIQAWGKCALDGYVVKDGGVEELRAALEAVSAGREHFSEGVREVIRNGPANDSHKAVLSPRETELLPLLAQGLTLREAATRMTVSYKTADSYRTSLHRKLGIRDRVKLARYAIREKIIDP